MSEGKESVKPGTSMQVRAKAIENGRERPVCACRRRAPLLSAECEALRIPATDPRHRSPPLIPVTDSCHWFLWQTRRTRLRVGRGITPSSAGSRPHARRETCATEARCASRSTRPEPLRSSASTTCTRHRWPPATTTASSCQGSASQPPTTGCRTSASSRGRTWSRSSNGSGTPSRPTTCWSTSTTDTWTRKWRAMWCGNWSAAVRPE